MAFKLSKIVPPEHVGLHTAVSPEVIEEVLTEHQALCTRYDAREKAHDTPDYWWDGEEWQPHPAPEVLMAFGADKDETTWGRARLKKEIILLGGDAPALEGLPIADLRKRLAETRKNAV